MQRRAWAFGRRGLVALWLALALAACGTLEIHIETQVVIGGTGPAVATTPAPSHTAAHVTATTSPAPSSTPALTPAQPASPTPAAASVTPTASPSPQVDTPPPSPTAPRSPTPSPTPCLPWFFAPAPPACATAPPEHWQGAAQRFERGFMLWIEAPDKFFIFLSDSRSYLIVDAPYTRAEGQIVLSTPPPGRQAPVSGFDLVWRGAIAAQHVNFEDLPQRLGWAVEAERVYTTEYQCQLAPSRSEERCYLRDPQGTIIALTPLGAWAYFGD